MSYKYFRINFSMYETDREGINVMNIDYNYKKNQIIMVCVGYRIEQKIIQNCIWW